MMPLILRYFSSKETRPWWLHLASVLHFTLPAADLDFVGNQVLYDTKGDFFFF